MKSTVTTIRSELEDVSHKTQSLRKELTDKIEKAQVKLQAVEVSLDVQARKL
jgi:hypothetical protein